MKIKHLVKSLLAVVALAGFAACTQIDNSVEPQQPATLNLLSAQPSDNADGIWTKPISWMPNWNVSFTLTFDNEVAIADENPAGISLVNVYDGSAVETRQFEETHWTVVPGDDANSVVVKLVNAEGDVIGIKFGDEGYTLTVPAGIVSNAKGTAANEEITETFYTSQLAKDREGLPTALTVVSTLPADADDNGIWQKPLSWLSAWNVEFVVTFNEKVVIKNEKPQGISLVNTYNGKAIEEKAIEETQWVVKADANNENAIVVRLENEGGSVIGVKLEDEAYKLTIPEGIVTNEAGTVPNGEIVKVVYSSQAAVENNGRPSALTLVSVLPEDYDAEANLWDKPISWASTWNIKFIVTFEEDVKVAAAKPEGVTLLQKGSNESIITVKNLTNVGEVEWVVEAISDNSKAVLVRLADAELGGSKAAKLEDEAYTLTIPAGIVTNLDGDIANKEVKATFYSSEAAKQI